MPQELFWIDILTLEIAETVGKASVNSGIEVSVSLKDRESEEL